MDPTTISIYSLTIVWISLTNLGQSYYMGRPYRDATGEIYWLYCYGSYADLFKIKGEIDSCVHLAPAKPIARVSKLAPAVIKDNKVIKGKVKDVAMSLFPDSRRARSILEGAFSKCEAKNKEPLSKGQNYTTYIPFVSCAGKYVVDKCLADLNRDDF